MYVRFAFLVAVVALCSNATAVARSLESPEIDLVLVDASSGNDIGPFLPDATVDLHADGKSLTLRADVDQVVAKVRFFFDGDWVRTESQIPFMLNGKSGSDAYTMSFPGLSETGTHYIRVVATLNNERIRISQFKFEVVDSMPTTPTSPNEAPSIAPSQLTHSRKTAFLEKNGLVVMEVESALLVTPWKFQTSNPKGYTGSGYYRMNGNENNNGPPNGRLSYFFKINMPGTYRMAIHSYKNNLEREDYSNDCYSKLVGHSGYQGEDTKIYLGQKQFKWNWALKHEVGHDKHLAMYTFGRKGVYELQLTGRSKNFRMNRIVLFHEPTVLQHEAFDLANPESPRRNL